MPWAVAAAGIGLAGAAMSANAAGDAADTQAASAADATGEQRRQFDLNRKDLAPVMGTGVAANARLSQLLGLVTPEQAAKGPKTFDAQAYLAANPDVANDRYYKYHPEQHYQDYGQYEGRQPTYGYGVNGGPGQPDVPGQVPPIDDSQYGSLLKKFTKQDMEADPVYQSGLQFGLKQGTEGINNRAIAGGGYDSGATLKALTRYAEDYGSTKGNEAFNRYNIANDSIYNKLAGVSGAGQTATNQAVTSGSSIANNIGGLMTDAGNARAAGIIGGANAWGDAVGSVSKGINNYQTNDWLKGLTRKNQAGYVNMGSGTGADSDMFYG
jgi:hypothetical protein